MIKTEAVEGNLAGSLNPPVTKNHFPPSIDQSNQGPNHAGSPHATGMLFLASVFSSKT